MPRRDRSRGRVARPDETAPAEDGSDDADDEGEAEAQDSPDRGTIDDLLDDQVGDVSQQVLPGSRASLRIAPEVNPGFVETEVVNRMGLVLSLNLEFDPSRQQWVPAVVDKTERQAVEQTLSEDLATDDLSGSVDTDDSTTVDSNGDLKLDEGTETENDIKDSADATDSAKGHVLFQWDNGPASGEVTGTFDGSEPPNPKCEIVNVTKNTESDFFDMSTPEFSVPFSGDAGDEWSIRVYRQDEASWDANEYRSISTPLTTGYGDVWGQAGVGDSAGTFYAVDKVGSVSPAEEGTATSTFANPCAASSTRSAQHDVCSKTSDVTVDLYNGDPNSEDSTLLARNIDQREDISDLPDAFTDLQYKLTLRRDENGESPKVGRLGHQLIR